MRAGTGQSGWSWVQSAEMESSRSHRSAADCNAVAGAWQSRWIAVDRQCADGRRRNRLGACAVFRARRRQFTCHLAALAGMRLAHATTAGILGQGCTSTDRTAAKCEQINGRNRQCRPPPRGRASGSSACGPTGSYCALCPASSSGVKRSGSSGSARQAEPTCSRQGVGFHW